MSIGRITNWAAGDTLTAAALNSEFDNVSDKAPDKTGTESVTGLWTFTNALTISNNVTLAGQALEFGSQSVSQITHMDWHCDGLATDYNLRVSKAAGTNSAFTIDNRGSSTVETGNIELTVLADSEVIVKNGNLKVEGQGYSPTAALTDAASISTDCNLGNVFSVTLAGNRTLANPTNLKGGATYIWRVTQDATGSRTLAYGNGFKWANATVPVLTTAANAVDVISGVSNGTQIYCTLTKNFA